MEFVVVVGTYEHLLYGFYCLENDQAKATRAELRLDPMFISSSHLNGITSLSTQKRFLASGSYDETVKIYDLKKRIEVGSLMQHNGAVNAIAFYGSHMLSGGQDGVICVWETKQWECLVTLKAHKGGVIDFSVHPSGKVALSIGKDKSMKMWDLVKGKSAFKTRLVRAPQIVRWSPNGTAYCLVDETKLTIYAAADNTVTHTITAPKKIVSLAFLTAKLVVLGCEEGVLQCWDVETGTLTHDFVGHKSRVRGLSVTDLPLHEDAVEGKPAGYKMRHFLVSGSSEGAVKVWEVSEPTDGQTLPITIDVPKAQEEEEPEPYIHSPLEGRMHIAYCAPSRDRNAQPAKAKKSRRAKKKPKKQSTARVVIEDEQTQGKNKKRKRGTSPAPRILHGGAPNQAHKKQWDTKERRNASENVDVLENKPKESRFKKRKQQEEKMIADAVFDDSNQSKKKKKKQPHDAQKDKKKGQNQQLNPHRPKKATQQGAQPPGRGKKQSTKAGGGGRRSKKQGSGSKQGGSDIDENFFLQD